MMKMHKTQMAAALIALLTPLSARAQTDSAAAPRIGPAVQRIATASAISTEKLGVVTAVRELPGGQVLVNDPMRRRLLMLDSSMKTTKIILDSLSEVSNAYGPRAGSLIPFRGDTTFFVDPASYAMLVLDPEGKIGRVRSVWRAQDVQYFSAFGPQNGFPAPDAKGRIIYRIPAQPLPQRGRVPSGVPYIPPDPDSAFIVAVNLDTRKLDTLTSVRTPKNELRVRQLATGGYTFDQVVYPIPMTDEWAVLPDGTVAIVRGRDYRVEYLHADGTVTSSAKLPFEWQRLTDEDKQKLIDSVKVAQQKQSASSFVTSMIRWVNLYGRAYPKGFKAPEGFTLFPGLPKDWILPEGVKFPPNYIYACPPGVDPNAAPAVPSPAPGTPAPAPGTAGAPGMPSCFPAPISFTSGGTPPPPTPRPVIVASVLDLPDYRPPFSQGAVRADMEGNLWVRTNPAKPVPGGPVFDIISPAGELVNRLQLPPGYSLVGFGKGKVVYLSTRDAAGIHVARVRLK